MKRLFMSTTCAVFFLAFGSTAFATTNLELVSGNDIIYWDGTNLLCSNNAGATDVSGAVACNGAGYGFGVTATNAQPNDLALTATTFDGWDVSQSTGGSNTPNCPSAGGNGVGCLNQDNVEANLTGSSPSSLGAYFASTGFTLPATQSQLVVANATVLQTGTLETQTAYANAGVVDPLTEPILNSNPVPATGQCGSALSSGPTGVLAQSTGCATPASPFSLELALVMTSNSGGAFNVNGNITAVPEPAGVALFGTVLVLCTFGLKRRRKLS